MAPEAKKRLTDFINKALVQEEVLVSISQVLERKQNVSPCFLHSLGTIIEAVVIHDTVFYDTRRRSIAEPDSRPTIDGMLRESDFVKQLVRGGALTIFPNGDEVNDCLSQQGRDYTFASFLSESLWRLASFYARPENEYDRYDVLLDIVTKAPILLNPARLVPTGDSGIFVDDDARAAMSAMLGQQIGVSRQDLLIIEGLNFRAKAYLDLSRNLGLQLHPFYLSLPHQVGAIRDTNRKAFELYQTIKTRLKDLDIDDEPQEDPEFQRIEIEPLCQLVLSRSKDSVQALPEEILHLRDRHSKLRRYLTQYERAWNAAKRRAERIQLKSEFKNAWQSMIARENKPSTRWTYNLWDIVKNLNPVKMAVAAVDKLANRGREDYIINRVQGLYDFWKDLCDTPLAKSNRILLARLFPGQVDERVWAAAGKLATAIDKALTTSSDPNTRAVTI